MARYDFTPAFERQILRLALTTPVNAMAQDCFQAEFFGEEGNAQPPRYVIAREVQRHAEVTNGDAPGIELMDIAVMKVAKRISSAMTLTMTGGSTIWRTSRRRRGGVVVGAVEAVGVAVVAPAVVGGSGQYYYNSNL